jgi:hypothetical protein
LLSSITKGVDLSNSKVHVSWWEIFDRMTVLQAKLEVLILKDALENVPSEQDQPQAIYSRKNG